MTSNSTLRILEELRKNSKGDKELQLFLESILSEEIKGRHRWREYYNDKLEEYIKDWDDYEN
ncbi:MAG: hypothetical protein HPY60_10895 [Candidatus Methanofastidiosum sp.]|nr:hypothetical protein [Methanofastidiosum sp.]